MTSPRTPLPPHAALPTHLPLPRHARFAGLDGLRAIAVALVVVYHLFPGSWLRSGFVGVDVFFVISGFLITSLLLRERARTGGIRLVEFWRRRARRLLPALAVVVTVAATWAWLVGGDVLVQLGRQVAGAAIFGYNWVSIAGGSDYFSADSPELLRNIWSLAVEEQFYVLWPLILPLLLLVPRVWARVVVTAVAGVGSATWMLLLITGGSGPTRAYFGTDSHAFGLLLGVALAVGLEHTFTAPPTWLAHPAARRAAAAVGLTAIAGLVAVAMLPETTDAATFPGTLVLASVLTGVAIVAATLPGSMLGGRLDWAPMRWIGDRSYGIYLWHWPLMVLIAASAGGATASDLPIWVGLTTLAATLALAAVSFRFIEQPVRRGGFRAASQWLTRRLVGTPVVRLRMLGVLALGAVVAAGTTAAIAVAPAETSAQSAVGAGAAALARAAEATPAPRPPLLPDDEQATSEADPVAVDGRQIDAVGDSVMLAAAPALMDRYPGIHVDAKVSRSMYVAPGILRTLSKKKALRRYVVLGLGTNGYVDPDTLRQVRATLGPDRQLVLITAHAPRSWIAGVNKTLRAFAADHPDVYVADWSGAISSREEALAGDRIHPDAAGGRIYADTLAATIAQAQQDRAEARQRILLRVAQLVAVRPA